MRTFFLGLFLTVSLGAFASAPASSSVPVELSCEESLSYTLKSPNYTFDRRGLISLLNCLGNDHHLTLNSFAMQNNRIPNFETFTELCIGQRIKSSQVFTAAKKLVPEGWYQALHAAGLEGEPRAGVMDWSRFTDQQLIEMVRQLIIDGGMTPRVDALRDSESSNAGDFLKQNFNIETTGKALYEQLARREYSWTRIMESAGLQNLLGNLRGAPIDEVAVINFLRENQFAVESRDLIENSEAIRLGILQKFKYPLSGVGLYARIVRRFDGWINFRRQHLLAPGEDPAMFNPLPWSKERIKTTFALLYENKILPFPYQIESEKDEVGRRLRLEFNGQLPLTTLREAVNEYFGDWEEALRESGVMNLMIENGQVIPSRRWRRNEIIKAIRFLIAEGVTLTDSNLTAKVTDLDLNKRLSHHLGFATNTERVYRNGRNRFGTFEAAVISAAANPWVTKPTLKTWRDK